MGADSFHAARVASVGVFLIVSGCGDSGGGESEASATATATGTATETASTSPATTTPTATSPSTGETGTTSGTKFDLPVGEGSGTTGVVPPSCKVVDDMDAVGECEVEAPPDSFEPDVQWEWTGNPDKFSIVTAMVANLTDDNGDDEIDLCDIPDVVVVAYPQTSQPGHIHVLDGATGVEHYQIADPIDWGCNPALGDIDDDGIPEIIAHYTSTLYAFEHDGTKKWESAGTFGSSLGSAVALADVDNDGDVEIAVRGALFDHDGNELWNGGWASSVPTPVFADLDNDDDHEFILGRMAFYNDGTEYWNKPELNTWAYPQVANLDDDPEPEILIESWDGISILEHDGTYKYENVKTTMDGGGDPWLRPATVHDFDGDNVSEFAVSTGTQYIVYERDLSIIWQAPVLDASGDATGTAFDFLGDGIAEAMYADEHNMHIYDGSGQPLLTQPRRSITHIEYPVVADIDNDGSAEIVISSNSYNGTEEPTVKVIRDIQDRWIQARRIWNQHTYHVTNVREDGTIPQFEPKHWHLLNTFRTNAQIEGGSVCKPEPEG